MSNCSRGVEFWPPVKKQKLATSTGEFILQSTETLTVYLSNVGRDSDSFLVTSGFKSLFDSFGFKIELTSSVERAKINLSIISTVARQNYEIQVESSGISIVAGDYAGLLYAVYTFIQLIQLFSHVAETNGTSFSVPFGSIVDKPDVDNRAILIPHADLLDIPFTSTKEQVRQLSQLHITDIHLLIDFDSNVEDIISRIHDLVAYSLDFNINVTPVVQFTNSNGKFSLPILAAVSVSKTIIVLFQQTHSGIENVKTEADACLIFLEGVFLNGFTNAIVSCSEWVKSNINPADLATKAGLNVVEREMVVSYPSVLFANPIACVQDYVQSLLQNLTSASQFAVYPVCDNNLPLLFRKTGLAIFAGLVWNRNYIQESLGLGNVARNTVLRATTLAPNRISFDFSPFKRALQHILLSSSGTSKGGEQSYAEVALPGVLCGENVNYEIQTAVANQPVDLRSEHSLSLSGVIRAEKLLWALLNAKGLIEAPENIPNKLEISLCLKIYTNILHQSHWESTKIKHRPEVVEVYNTISTLASLCKAIIWMHNAWHATSIEQTFAVADNQNMHQKRAAVYDNVDTSKPYIAKEFPKSDEIRELLTYVVQQNILFRNYQAEEHVSIVKAFECVNTVAGDIVIQQGDPGEYFYIIESGAVDVFMECSGLKIKIGQTLRQGKYFGELALMYNTPRAATVISSEDCVLWRIDRQTYRTIVTHHNKETSAEFVSLISNVYILGKRLGDVLSNNELNKVVSSLEIEEFENDSVIVRQYLTGDYFYIITEGQVDVWQEAPSDTGNTSLMGKKVATLSRGNYFGEKALLADDVRQASCVAVGKVTCLSLSREDFIAMLGSWQDLTGGLRSTTDHTSSTSGMHSQMSIVLNDLQTISTLGVGAFGKVKLARHKVTQQTFAVKFQSKSFITSQNMQQMIESEARIMSMIDHPCIAKLYASMQDTKFVYFILELLPGGEFFSYLQTAGKLTEDKARFYSAAVVSAFEEMHRQKIAYRDLKPENMVLDSRGYVKLVDLGLAKQVLSGSTWTMCGTPDYLAPELVLNKGHDYAVDYWALGVLIYEMIHGWPPFFHDNPMKIYEKIISGKVNYPETFSHTLEDIVSKFLIKNPSKRLGNMKGGIADVMKHKWYGSFDWKGLVNGTIAPPYVPDLSNFNTTEPNDDVDEDEEEMDDSDWVAKFN